MTTLFQTTTESSTNQSAADFEPDEQWKSRLKVNIESNLRSMVDEAKQNLNDTLKRAPVSAVERERLSEEHLATMKNIRNLAEEQFRIALERERQERRWAAGQALDQEWSDTMIEEQKAIMQQIERERKDKAAHPSSSSSQPIADPSISRSSRSPERVWTPHEHTESEHEADYFPRLNNRELEEDHVSPPRDIGKARAGSVGSGIGSYKPPSTLDTTDRGFERPKPSPTIDELDDMPRSTPSRSATDAHDSIRRGSLRRKASISTRQLPEFWLPSITPEQDAQMSRTFSMARRGSTASTTSSYRAPSVLNIPFSSEPHEMMPTSATERERDRISAAEQEWSPMDRARDRERTTSYTYAEARATIPSTQRLDDRYPPHLSSVAPIPSSAIPYSRPAESPSSTIPIAYTRPLDSPSSTAPIGYTRSSDSSRPHAPPPSASRPIATKKSFTFDDGGFQSSPSPKGWNGPSRSPYDTRYETSRSPQTPEEVPRSWQSSSLRARPSSQDMRYGYNAGETAYYAARPVHTHHEVSEGEYDVDLDDAEWREYDERQMRQREDDFSLRRREEEVARREQELRRREEDARREEETKLKEDELRRKEEETKRKEEETRRKEDEIKRKEVEARRRQEEADRKELEIRRMEEEARKKEEETKRKEDEIQRKEMLAKKKEEEVRRKEAQARKRAEDLRRQEEEVARRLEEEEKRVALEISRKSMEAKRKEDEVRRKEEDARLKEAAARAKEEEIQRKEEELARREEELLRREAEAIRRSDDKQKVQQDEFRKREEEIRRQRAEEKKRQERFEWEAWGYSSPETSRPTPPPQMSTSQSQSSSSSTGPWPIPNRSDRSMPGPSPPTDRSSSGSTSTSRSSTAWTSSTRPSSTASSQPPSTPKPPTPSAQQNAKAAPGPPPTPFSEAEFHRRQAEQAQQREEQFRREQAKLEQERLLKTGKALGKQDTIKLFEQHRGQWDKLQISGVLGVLIWDDFPWPVFKRPSGPDDVTTACITAYMLSSLHPTDKTPKDRIKENIRRWHPDRFETQLLPKVKESDRDVVREAAGTVVRVLNDLLRSSTQEFS